MNRTDHTMKNNKVSALDSALKLLMTLYRKVRYYIGLLLIDIALRRIVCWYDKSHPNSNKKKANYSEDVALLNEKIISLQRTVSELNNSLGILKSKESVLISQRESLFVDINNKTKELATLNEEMRRIHSQNDELRNENDQLLGRCLPETDIPSMIYYAQGDASGLNFRKISTIKTPQHIYKISTIPGNAASAIFEPIVESDLVDVINNRNLTLIACDILSIASNASAIVVCEKGRAIKKNNKWIVTCKAKIILS